MYSSWAWPIWKRSCALFRRYRGAHVIEFSVLWPRFYVWPVTVAMASFSREDFAVRSKSELLDYIEQQSEQISRLETRFRGEIPDRKSGHGLPIRTPIMEDSVGTSCSFRYQDTSLISTYLTQMGLYCSSLVLFFSCLV